MIPRVVALCVVLAACGTGAQAGGQVGHEVSASTSVAAVTLPTASTNPAAAPTGTAPPPLEPPAPAFMLRVGQVTAADLGSSWREGCPVDPTELRRLEVSHWDTGGRVRQGELIVHTAHAEDLGEVFSTLFDAGFPVHSMRPVDEFDADDDASMAADNTSAFNCRMVAGTDRWSEHAYGTAIDVNPLVNPYVRGDRVDPPGGAPFTDRTRDAPGMIVAGDAVVAAFAAIGWSWGGEWAGASDYQHFSASGR